MEEARKEYTEALQTYRELAQKNPEIYRPDVAATLNNVGVLDSDQGRMEEARKEFAEAAADLPRADAGKSRVLSV